MPYGYHNFLFGWIDTPFDNLPPLLPNELVPIVMSLVSKVIPNEIKILFTDGLNKRLGKNGLSIEEVAALAAKREMEIQDLMAMPE